MAHSNFWSSISTAIIFWAPANLEPTIAAFPTPPHPKTATESPIAIDPVFIAAPRPAITPQPSKEAVLGLTAASTFIACPASTNVNSEKAPMPKAGERVEPSSNDMF